MFSANTRQLATMCTNKITNVWVIMYIQLPEDLVFHVANNSQPGIHLVIQVNGTWIHFLHTFHAWTPCHKSSQSNCQGYLCTVFDLIFYPSQNGFWIVLHSAWFCWYWPRASWAFIILQGITLLKITCAISPLTSILFCFDLSWMLHIWLALLKCMGYLTPLMRYWWGHHLLYY